MSKSTCRVCGDEIGCNENGEVFSACHVCKFPVCRPCYDYERSDGNQCCPQCNTRYKRHRGVRYYVHFRIYALRKFRENLWPKLLLSCSSCPRVAGDDEDEFDGEDFDDEFPVKNHLQLDHSDQNPLANDSVKKKYYFPEDLFEDIFRAIINNYLFYRTVETTITIITLISNGSPMFTLSLLEEVVIRFPN